MKEVWKDFIGGDWKYLAFGILIATALIIQSTLIAFAMYGFETYLEQRAKLTTTLEQWSKE